MFGRLAGRRARLRSRFEELALPHLDSLYRTALRLSRSERDAEDLVQDALLRAYKAFDQFSGDERIKPWLFKILTNTFINRYRRRVLERSARESMEREGPSGMATYMAGVPRSPEEMLGLSTLSDDVRGALEKLPGEFRLAVVLCDIEDFSYREIADIMECPVGTVMSRLSRGRRMLQSALREYAQREGIIAPSSGEGEVRQAAVIPLLRRDPSSRGG